MEPEIITATFAIITALSGVFFSSRNVKHRMAAEKELIEHVANRIREINDSVHVIEGSGAIDISKVKALQEEQLLDLIGKIEKISRELSTENRDYILGAIEQPSLEGRARYIEKLMSETKSYLEKKAASV